MIRATIYVDDDEGNEYELPGEKKLCEHCRGTGGCSCHFGSFTSSDLDERGVDDDWLGDYMSGRFDRECHECKGTKVITSVAEDAERTHPEAWKAYCEQQSRDYYDALEKKHLERYV